MKLSFLIYLLLLLIDGLVAWQATGSPMLIVFPLVGIVFYGALSNRPGAVPEVVRILFSGLMITFGLMNFGNHLPVIFLTLLSLPHYLAATQTVWEMQNVGSEQAHRAREMRVSVFSMAFYASWGVAFLLLTAENLKLAKLHQQLLAGIVFVLGLVAWECSRVLKLKAGRTPDQLSRGSYWRRVVMVMGGALLAVVAFSAVLPPVAEALCTLSPKWHPPEMDLNLGPPHRPKTNPNDVPAGGESAQSPSKRDADESARTGRMTLPKRVDLKLTEDARAYLQFGSPEEAQALQKQGPVYLRSFALSAYDNFEWGPSSQDGFWIKDEEDGKKDRIVTTAPDTAGSMHYTVFVPEADGSVLALPGLKSVDAPKVYALPDEWFQIQDTGRIRYGARSEPKIWGRFPGEKTKADNPGVAYLRVPEGRLGEELKQLKDEIFKFHQSPQECIPALQGFFREHYKYSTKVENKNSLPPLENFLLDERQGYCDLFATSAALLLRKVGIPTRLGFGYMAGDYYEKEGLIIFRQRHAHSWVEVKLEDHGWVICEFTPEAPAAAGTPGNQVAAQAPNLENFNDVSAPPTPSDTAKKVDVPEPGFLAQLGQLWPSFADPKVRTALALVVLGFAGFAWWKRFSAQQTPEEKARRAAAAREQQPAYVHELRELAKTMGITFSPGDTVKELRRLLQGGGCDHPELTALTKYHYTVRYEDAEKDRHQESEFLSLLKQWRSDWLKKKQA